MKEKYLVGAFLATALLISGCGDNTEESVEQSAPETQTKLAGQRLTDDSGVEYTLIDNGDGTETARYDDGRAVTFRREEDGSLDFVSGTAGLLAGMAAGYFLFHGLSNSGGGTWDSSRNRYTVNEPVRRDERISGSSAGAGTAARSSSSSNSGGVNLSKPAASSSSPSDSFAKTGFGGAGARAGTSAVS
ncbi:MAG: hypothetical protein J5809_02940 [Selenomonadaceae bacterium]|nr:hypothetical protein [Selenomonadaceae bacterium]